MRTVERRSRRVRKKPMAEINIVPYIDVMLVLLVIFMVATPLLTQGVKVNLPAAKSKSLQSQQLPIIVTVNAEGQYFVNSDSNSSLSAQQLAVRVAAQLQIAKQKGEIPQVLVKGDDAVAYGKVVQAMVLLQRAGVEKVGLMTQEPK
jgi:biopolymer transport protein TolR